MSRPALIFFYGYTAMLLCVGFSGIFIAHWELQRIFGIKFSLMNHETAATILNQYRFLKAMEFSFGLFCISYRRDIFSGGGARMLFLGGVFAGVAARTISIIANGWPQWVFVIFLLLELATGILVLIQPRRPA